jgi:hypothetical protein
LFSKIKKFKGTLIEINWKIVNSNKVFGGHEKNFRASKKIFFSRKNMKKS